MNLYTKTCMVEGTCWTRPDSPLAWVQIPKNASSWGQLIFHQQLNFDKKLSWDNTDLSNKKFIIFLRHPIQRWFTGISQYLLEHHPDIDINNELLLNLIFSAVVFDEHTFPQVWYLHNINYDNCVFFDIADPNFFKNVQHYIFTTTKQVINDPGPRNVSTEVDFKQNVISVLEKTYNSNYKYLDHVNYKLHPDWELYSNVRWQAYRK